MRRQVNDYWPAIVLITSSLALTAVAWEWKNPLRWGLVFWFLMICPGMAFAYLLPKRDQITKFFLIIVLSFSIDTAVAQIVLYSGKWSPYLILLILTGICWMGIFLKFIINISRPLNIDKSISSLGKTGNIDGIRFYLSILKRGWWLILITVLISINMSLLYSYFFEEPMYEAVARFIITPNLRTPNEAGALTTDKPLDKNSTLSIYADNLNSYQIRFETLEILLQDPDKFKEYTTSVALLPNEAIIEFSVKGPNPDTVTLLANSIGQHAIDSIRTFYFEYDINFLESASVPIKPYRPNPAQETVLSFLIGLVMGVGLALLWSQLYPERGLAKA